MTKRVETEDGFIDVSDSITNTVAEIAMNEDLKFGEAFTRYVNDNFGNDEDN